MENLIFLLTASLVMYQTKKKPRKLFIADTNYSLFYFPEASFEYTQSDEGDVLYFAEHQDKLVSYGVLCARLAAPLPIDEARDVMSNYMGRLHKPFHALYNTGIDLCKTPEGAECIQLLDYWQDDNGLDWKVKGYTDGQTIAVLYVKNINELEVEKQDRFLDSFCFGK